MVQNLYYHLVDAIVYLIAAAIPIFFILKSRKSMDNNNSNHLLKLTTVLVGFILIQVFYHIAGIAVFWQLQKAYLEQFSMAVLIVLGITYLVSIRKARKKRQQEVKL